MKKNYFRLVIRLLLLIVLCIVMPLIFFVAKAFGYRNYEAIPRLFHRACCVILGLDVKTSGEISAEVPCLYVSNHISYLDIFALGQFVPGYFIAKSEIASWPVLGKLATLQNTLFIERNPKRARMQFNIMRGYLEKGKNLILFPEGTSTDGAHVEPFKSSLFESANISNEHGKRVAIQPITIAYTHYDGVKMDQEMRDHYAWYAEMPFASHLLTVMSLKKVSTEIVFHQVLYLDDYETRKICADDCQRIVAESLEQLI